MPLTLLLLVEDDARQRDALRSLFEESSSDVAVHVAQTLKEAQSHEKSVDAVLLDLDLPDSHGLATLTSVLERFAPVPVVVLTAATDQSIAEEAISLGAYDYLEKALIPPAAIHRVVRDAMRHSRERVAAAERDAQKTAVAEFGELALGNISTEALRGNLCDVIANVLHADGVMFMERTGDDVLLARHTVGCTTGQWLPVGIDETGPIAEAVRTNRTVRIDDVRGITEPATAQRFREVSAVSVAAVPVRTKFNAPEGALVVWRRELRPFGENETAFLDAMANIVAAAMQRNAMQEALRVSQQEIEQILDAVPDRILRFDQDLCVQYLNHAARRDMPMVRIGMHVDELAVPAIHRPQWRAMLERALATGVAERFDTAGMIHASFRFDVSVVPLVDTESRSVVVVLRNITDRVRTQTRYETLFASNVVGVFFCDSEGVITQANRAFLEMVDHDETTVARRRLKLHDVMGLPAHAIHAARLREIRKHGVLPPLPADLVHRLGHTVPVLLASAVVQQTPEEIVTFVVDETGTRRAEAEKRNQTLLLDSARDAIILRDMDGVICFWNDGARRLYGWRRSEAVGRRMADLIRTTGDSTAFAIDASVLSRGEWQGELHQQTRDGKQIVVDSRFSRIPSAYGEAPMMLIITTDITERKSLERQLLHAQRIETLGMLASGIAHDLNNILLPMLMGAEYLRRLGLPPAAEETLDRMMTSSRRGAEIIRQLLTFAGGHSGDNELTDPARIVAEVERLLRETTPPSIRIETEVGESLWTIACDATQMLQILLNLGLNARDAMPNGGTVTIHAENVEIDAQYANMNPGATPGAYVMLSVSDTGSGIPAEIIERIFEPFFTTKAAGGGTGLGLATARSIVRSHGGFMNVYSEPGTTVFKVYMPAVSEGSASRNEDEPPPVVRGNGELILVIDDEMAIRDVTAATLKSYGYRVLIAADGSEGIALYAQNPDVAVVLTDMLMPVLDGPTTIRALRKLNPHVRIIGMSGYTRQRMNEAAPDLLLQKPFRAADLLHAISSTLSAPGR
jgi:two-component system cell cycle sensor histidine kinase/response regulator CckA